MKGTRGFTLVELMAAARSGAFDRPSLDAHGPADCPQAVR